MSKAGLYAFRDKRKAGEDGKETVFNHQGDLRQKSSQPTEAAWLERFKEG